MKLVLWRIILLACNTFLNIFVLISCDEKFLANSILVKLNGTAQSIASIAQYHRVRHEDSIDFLSFYMLAPDKTFDFDPDSLQESMTEDKRLAAVMRQSPLVREKREIIHGKILHVEPRKVVNKSVYFRVNTQNQRLVLKDTYPVDETIKFSDPYFTDEWYIKNNGQTGGRPGIDMNVLKVWKAGYTGKGVVVCILDDGIDYTHPDLTDNYDEYASIDLNDKDDQPLPRYEDPSNSHGTKCAGEVAAKANNSNCGVGIAYDSRIAGIRLLDGTVTDFLEAKGLTYKCNYTDIYSASWGPKDNGAAMEGPLLAAQEALQYGVQYGRKGRGTIYVWATGNGGLVEDDCNADGYVSSIETLSIGSVTDLGERPYFMELCPSTFAVVPTGGMTAVVESEMDSKPKIKVVTTDLNHDCTLEFQGTSSAAPMAAGCVALVLQANPNLGWRDVQHIVAKSARIPGTSGTWTINGAGLHLSTVFGFGVIDCARMVKLSLSWHNVSPQKTCIIRRMALNLKLSHQKRISLRIHSDGCRGNSDHLTHLEHVQLFVHMKHDYRGKLQILLISPQNTTSEMLSPRPNDKHKGVFNFTFMTVRNWNETSVGTWRIVISNAGIDINDTTAGELYAASLILHGFVSNASFDPPKLSFDLTRQQVNDLMKDEEEKSRRLSLIPGKGREKSSNSQAPGNTRQARPMNEKTTRDRYSDSLSHIEKMLEIIKAALIKRPKKTVIFKRLLSNINASTIGHTYPMYLSKNRPDYSSQGESSLLDRIAASRANTKQIPRQTETNLGSIVDKLSKVLKLCRNFINSHPLGPHSTRIQNLKSQVSKKITDLDLQLEHIDLGSAIEHLKKKLKTRDIINSSR